MLADWLKRASQPGGRTAAAAAAAGADAPGPDTASASEATGRATPIDAGGSTSGLKEAHAVTTDLVGAAVAAAGTKRKRAEDQKKGATWEAQLARLAAYKAAHGDCDVPQEWAEDPGLAGWVKNQRACKNMLEKGRTEKGRTGMTAERAAKLTLLGLV